MIESHMAFYYTKYFKKALNAKFFGTNTLPELLAMVKDSVVIQKKEGVPDVVVCTETTAACDKDSDAKTGFVTLLKLTEQVRRDRQRRIDAGDETAKLKFSVLAVTKPADQEPVTVKPPSHVVVPPKAKHKGGGKWDDDQGSKGWGKGWSKGWKGGGGKGKKGWW